MNELSRLLGRRNTMRTALARITNVAAIVLALNWGHEASGQCMQWDGSPGAGMDGSDGVQDLRVLNIGGGPAMFTAAGYGVARWTGTSWVPAGNSAFDDHVLCVGKYDSGSGPQLYAGGQFSEIAASHNPAFRLAKLVNGTWVGVHIPAPDGAVGALAEFDDGQGLKLFVGGSFSTYSSLNSLSIVTWNGTAFGGVGGGLASPSPNIPAVAAMCSFDDGTGPALYVAGGFSTAGGVPANNIAKWDGTTWAPLGSGLTFPSSGTAYATAMTVFDDGTGPAIYVCGRFDHAGGLPAKWIARWDGTNWFAVPGLTEGGQPYLSTTALNTHVDGDGPALYIGLNSFGFIGQSLVWGVARWDGQVWSSLGGGFGGPVYALETFDDSQGGGSALWVGGHNTNSVGGNLYPWDIARWYGGCTGGIDPICFGDGTFAACPCSNYGAAQHGCANSVSSQGAVLSATGTTTPDTLVLQSLFEPTSCLSIFVQSSSLLPIQFLFGDGILCLGGQLRRLYVKTASAGVVQAPQPGDLSITQQSAALGDPIAPGSGRYYQVWYRDGEPSFCTPASFNVSNGLRVVW